jgi:hypothetical protein
MLTQQISDTKMHADVHQVCVFILIFASKRWMHFCFGVDTMDFQQC